MVKAFVNTDNEILAKAAKNLAHISYGINEMADYQGKLTDSVPYIKCNIKLPEDTINIVSHLTGIYNFENILAAVAVGGYFQVEPEKIKKAIENYLPDNNRSQVVKTKNNTLILDAYNANPTSMKAAISSFEETAYKNKALILGEMKELGKFSGEEHTALVDSVAGKMFDPVIYIGKEYANINIGNAIYFSSTSKLIDYLKVNPIKDKTILVKGSRSNKLEDIYNLL
ncbi:MAG: cyanophycin synthetase [Bacteroidales bacterium]